MKLKRFLSSLIAAVLVFLSLFTLINCSADNDVMQDAASPDSITSGSYETSLYTEGISESASSVQTETVNTGIKEKENIYDSIPEYDGSAYIELNGNKPKFDEILTESYEYYSELDELGRCGMCIACVGKDILPNEERGEIGMIQPSGWHTVRYDDLIEDKYLYNRCHLIAYELTGENDNIQNLITGTRYLNVSGMLPFENMTAQYVSGTGNHVMYRSTPIFEGDDLVARGVQLEGYSVEDSGEGICFNVFCYNVQPGISIDYSTGDSSRISEDKTEDKKEYTYILNTNTKRFHYPYCDSVNDMKEKNKQEYTGTREELIDQGYIPCGRCNP